MNVCYFSDVYISEYFFFFFFLAPFLMLSRLLQKHPIFRIKPTPFSPLCPLAY